MALQIQCRRSEIVMAINNIIRQGPSIGLNKSTFSFSNLVISLRPLDPISFDKLCFMQNWFTLLESQVSSHNSTTHWITPPMATEGHIRPSLLGNNIQWHQSNYTVTVCRCDTFQVCCPYFEIGPTMVAIRIWPQETHRALKSISNKESETGLSGTHVLWYSSEIYVQTSQYTVQCRYNVVNFHPNPHKRHPIARGMGRFLRTWSLMHVSLSHCRTICEIILCWTAL